VIAMSEHEVVAVPVVGPVLLWVIRHLVAIVAAIEAVVIGVAWAT
jgi:hypothetical protein